MAFENDADRDLAKELIGQHKTTKEIREALGDRCKDSDIYQLRSVLKNGLPQKKERKPRTPKADQPEKPVTRKVKESSNPIINMLVEESNRCRARMVQIDKLLELYENEIPLPASLAH